jgi:DNA polymerase-3 subunit delta
MPYKNQEQNASVMAELKSQIKNKKPARVYLFHGNEPFLIDYYIGEIKKLVLQNDETGLNFSSFENKTDINDIIDACDTFPVFADKKLVLVKNSSLFTAKTKKDAALATGEASLNGEESHAEDGAGVGSKAQEALKQYIPDIPETTCLVFCETQVDKRLGAYKQIARHGIALEFNRLSERELISWVAKGFKTMGKIITEEAAQHFVTLSEPDMYALKNEMLKINAYAGIRKEITFEDIKLMTTPTIKSVIFDLLDAVAEQNASRALSLLSDMLSIKEPEQKILSMLSKQTGEILKLKCLMKKGASQTDINKFFQGKHPYALKMLISQAQKIDEDYLRKLLKGCMEAEVSYKKGLIGARLSLETLLSRINS